MRPQTAPSGVSSEALAGRQQPQQQQLESGRAASDNASTQTDALPSDVSTNGAGEQQLGQQASDSTSSYSSPMSMLRQRGNAERPIREQAAEKEASDEQDPLSDQQKVEDRSRQALDEAEDSTSKMLQSSGT